MLGYEAFWTDLSKAAPLSDRFREIRESGFDTVRLNLHALAFLREDGAMDPSWYTVVDEYVREALNAGLIVILDEHDFDRCSESADNCEPRLERFWRNISSHYAAAPKAVLFELLNEPHGTITESRWNILASTLIRIVRRRDPTRYIIVGTSGYDNLRTLDRLCLPAYDHHLIVTFHYYDPTALTLPGDGHQPTATDWGSPEDLAHLQADFDKVSAWHSRNERPVLLGEFGVWDTVPAAIRAKYLSAVARAAEARGFAWAVWQFDHDFEIYDSDKGHWIPSIRDALVGGAR